MREWEEGCEDHLIIVPSTSTYHARAKLALMAWLCEAGYYFIHGGIKRMHGRVQPVGKKKIIIMGIHSA